MARSLMSLTSMPNMYADTCLVYQTEAQSNPYTVANSELDAGGKPL